MSATEGLLGQPEEGDPVPLRDSPYERLRELRAQVSASVQSLREELPAELPGVMDPEDASIEDVARDLEAAFAEIGTSLLHRIDAALQRLNDGSYGACASCERSIPPARLNALPFAERCRACEEQEEDATQGPRCLRSLFDPEDPKPWQACSTRGTWRRSAGVAASHPGSPGRSR